MAVNRDKPDRWKRDIVQSVDMYNAWFIRFAPEAYRTTRVQATQDVEATLRATQDLREISVTLLKRKPGVLPTLRMATCPPLAVDRLIGLASVAGHLVNVMEKEQKLPPRMPRPRLERDLEKIGGLIAQMADPDIFGWLPGDRRPSSQGGIEPPRLWPTVSAAPSPTRSSATPRSNANWPRSRPG